jgi:hypothetical protein
MMESGIKASQRGGQKETDLTQILKGENIKTWPFGVTEWEGGCLGSWSRGKEMGMDQGQ